MSLYKRGGKWWYEFTVRGERIRGSSGSSDRDVALLLEAERRQSLGIGTRGISPTLKASQNAETSDRFPNDTPKAANKQRKRASSGPSCSSEPTINHEMNLHEAGQIWLSTKSWKRRKPRTLEASRCYLNSLLRFFGKDMRLKDIKPESLLAYQTERSKQVGASYLNHELNALSQILKQAGLWAKLKDFYAPLPESEWQKPKVFTFQEQQSIFECTKEDPNLELADIVFTITRNTSASGCELRLARLGSLDFETNPPTFNITGDTTKNDIRPRLIPLNAAAEAAFRRAVTRAAKLGSHKQEHFIFPLRVNRAKWDPTKPASRSWLRNQTAKLRKRTGIEHLRPHAWRHQLCTEMLEQGVAPETVRGVMGWVSEKMIETYSHTRLEAKADALSVLERVGNEPIAPVARKESPTKRVQELVSNSVTMADLMHPAIQAEIARQVALAVQQLNLAPSPQTQPATNGLRLIAFPGAAVRPNGGSL